MAVKASLKLGHRKWVGKANGCAATSSAGRTAIASVNRKGSMKSRTTTNSPTVPTRWRIEVLRFDRCADRGAPTTVADAVLRVMGRAISDPPFAQPQRRVDGAGQYEDDDEEEQGNGGAVRERRVARSEDPEEHLIGQGLGRVGWSAVGEHQRELEDLERADEAEGDVDGEC